VNHEQREKLAALRLARSENVGPITYHRLLERFGSAVRALAALPELAKRGGRNGAIKVCPAEDAERELEKLSRFGCQLIIKGDGIYPPLLAEIEDAPPVLALRGRAELLKQDALGAVGARNASLPGQRLAGEFCARVGAAGYAVVSGLARGIDAAAHRAALKTGTVAVVAGGIDVVYPRENEALYAAICEQGAVVAESPFGTEPLARHFPRRNRIISGLSLGVLVVEAAAKSGSLITARMALEQNREVFAVPGSPLDPRAAGTNGLLRDGAHLAASAEDIVQVLDGLRGRPARLQELPLNKTVHGAERETAPPAGLRGRILEMLSPVPVQVDELIRTLNMPAAEILTVILELELAGCIERQPGNRVNLI
jgi:DNA processing protein